MKDFFWARTYAYDSGYEHMPEVEDKQPQNALGKAIIKILEEKE